MRDKLKILVKFPTRSRPVKFLEVLEKYFFMATDTKNISWLISYDLDDPTMNNSAVLDKLKDYPNLTAVGGTSRSKIDAINRDMDKAPAFDIIVLASDDMICEAEGWDETIRKGFMDHFPDTDGTLWFWDGDPATIKGRLCTMCILGRKYYARFGYIYHPDYISLWSDNEYTEVAHQLGKMKFSEQVLFKHVHFSNTPGLQPDQLVKKTQSYFTRDQQVFEKRKALNFDLDDQKPAGKKIIVIEEQRPNLSILIPTVVGREQMHDALKAKLKSQIEAAGLTLGREVEIISARDNKQISIGRKRKLMYEKARGVFSVQIDDDDDVADDFVVLINSAVQHAIKEGADCIGYQELCTFSHVQGKRLSNISLQYEAWREFSYADPNGFHHYRTPYCKAPIRTDLCVQAGVPDMRFGEDHEFAKRVYPLLQKEVYISKVMYLYNYVHHPNHNEKYGIKKQFA